MLCTVNEEALFASTPDESRLHSFRLRRSRHHGDVCVCIRSFATNQRYLLILGILTAVAEHILRSRSERRP
jgi:hypothetical protein